MATNKEKILITGGLGFIGSNLAKRLSDKYEIIIIDRDKSYRSEMIANTLLSSVAEIIQGDIAFAKTWKKIPECRYIFHAAAQVAAELSWDKPELDFQSNVFGTFLVAEYARKNNSRVIYCNSIRVYDPDAIESAMKIHGMVSEECATVDVSNKLQRR